MRIPISWLRDFVTLPESMSGREVSELLVGVGFEIEGVESVGDVRGPLVVGTVLSIEELTDYKKPIRWCRVEVGQAHGHADTPGIRGIICGARNFVEGDLVVIALPGTTLPGDFTITSRETYGHLSAGMICSQRELGLGDDHDGIMILPAGSASPGDDAFPILGLGDEVLDVAVTPDRGYALSIRGIARELSIAMNIDFNDPADNLALLPQASGSSISAASDDVLACDLLVLRTMEHFNPHAPTPDFIKARLAAVGVRSISLAVDVTNYVMFELGQPLHAFDADKVSGTLRARWAHEGETLETLDHVTRTLTSSDLVIADDKQALSLAGVMGGLSSEISDSTTRIVLEAAHFSPSVIAKMSRRHKLSSEASRRLERGVDRMLAPVASARAVELLIEFGGVTHAGTTAVETAPNLTHISFDPQLPDRVAGRSYDSADVKRILVALGCSVSDKQALWDVRVPTWRPDLVAPIDLVEEVIRIDGYHKVPSRLPVGPQGQGFTREQKLLKRSGLYLAGRGLVEVRNYPFMGVTELDDLGLAPDGSRRHALVLANPLSDEQPLMRTTLLPGLFAALARNASRGFTDVALFEIASVTLPRTDQPVTGATQAPQLAVTSRPHASELASIEALLPDQPLYLSIAMAHSAWNDIVEVVLSLAQDLGVVATVRNAQVAPWHPGRCAQIIVAGDVIGTAGEVAPRVNEAFGLAKRSLAAEVDLDALFAHANVVVRAPQMWTFPIAKEDIALVVKSEVAAHDVLEVVREAAGALLEEVRLFDVYQGAQVPAGYKSLAFALRFRAADRTLSADEVTAARQAAVEAAAAAFGATLRG